MRIYMIGYDLNRPGQDYGELMKAIKEISGTWWHNLDSTWLVKSDLTAAEIRDLLVPYMDSNDELLVASLTGEAAWRGFSKTGADWIRKHFGSVAV